MNPVFVILVLLVVLAGGEGGEFDLGLGLTPLRGWNAALMAFGPPLVALIAFQILVSLTIRRLDRTGRLSSLRTAEFVGEWLPWLALANHAIACTAFDWVGAVRAWVGGDLIVLDEIVAVAPPLLALAATWWIYFPVVRRLRQATMIRRLDDGIPVRMVPTRGSYVILQARLNVLLILVPILIIVALGEVVDLFIPVDPKTGRNAPINEITSFGATLVVLICSPLLARVLLTVKPLPPGEVREDLLDICRAHGVHVREILLWDTHGSMINGAVMGFLGILRYVLLTDALLESMRRDQLRAVMAHEIGHVRRRHMPWLIVAMLACLIGPAVLVEGGLLAFSFGLPELEQTLREYVNSAGLGLTLLAAFFAFGWISRRYERQADTFAVQHLSGVKTVKEQPRDTDGVEPVVTTHAATAMQSALEQVARLNAISPRRRSWRHGSILSRQVYLASLIGRPARALPIDRQIRTIKYATLLILLLSVGSIFLIPASDFPPDDDQMLARGSTFPPMAICMPVPR